MNAGQRERLLETLLEFDEPNSQMVDGYDYNWDKALDFIQQEIAKARIDENEMYMQEADRHYFPAGMSDPYIPLVQFHERIGELTLKEHKEK